MSPLLVVMFVVLFEGLCVGMAFPVLAFFGKALGGGGIAIGILFALTPLPKIVSNGVFGHWSDRAGRKPVMIVATVGGILGSLLWAQSTNLWILAAARLVTGIFGVHATLAQALAVDVSKVEKRAAAVGLLGASFGIAISLGPIFGGWIADAANYATVGYVAAGIETVSLLLIIFLLKEPPRIAVDHGIAPASTTLGLLRLPRIVPLLSVIFLTTAASMILLTVLGPYAEQLFAFDARKTGYLLGVFGVVGVLVQGGAVRPLVASFGEWAICLAGTIILGLGYTVFGLGSAEALLFAGVMIVGVGASLLAPTQTAQLSRCIGSVGQGGLLGLNQGVTALGRVVGAGLAGALMTRSIRLPFVACAGFAALAVAALLLSRPRPVPAKIES
ncbi:MAG: MFS transporter [Phycisphaerae bacterium]